MSEASVLPESLQNSDQTTPNPESEKPTAEYVDVFEGVVGYYLASDGKTRIKFSLNHGTTPEKAKKIITGNNFDYGHSTWD